MMKMIGIKSPPASGEGCERASADRALELDAAFYRSTFVNRKGLYSIGLIRRVKP